jgi:zinc transporter ZupT
VPLWVWAGLWGLVAGSALLLGAAIGYFARVPQRLIAGIMAFGGGVLISALSFDLMDEAYQRGGFDSTAIGFLGGPPSIPPRTGTWPTMVPGIGNAPGISNHRKVTRTGAAWPSPWAPYSTGYRSRS